MIAVKPTILMLSQGDSELTTVSSLLLSQGFELIQCQEAELETLEQIKKKSI